jgi:type III pantothenate kinase
MTASRLLAIKIGNTNLGFGIFDAEKLTHTWRAETRTDKTSDEYAALLLSYFESASIEPTSIQAAAMVSVVPALTEIISEVCTQHFQCKPFIAASGVKSGIKIRYEDPRTFGADRLTVLVAAKAKYGAPCILIDFGTATTFNVLNAKGDFIGGAIAPGLNMSAQALHEFTARLPLIEISAPEHSIATNTRDALRSGIILGYVGLVEGLITRFKREMNEPKARVIATGGRSALIASQTQAMEIVDRELALDGLRLLYEMNV